MSTFYKKGPSFRWARLLSLLLLLPFVGRAQTPVDITSSYAEPFDGMGATGTAYRPGWTAIRYAGTSTIGATLTLVVNNGSGNPGAIYNVGTTGNANRALGSLASGGTIPRFGAAFKNTTGSTITQLDLAGFMEQWKTGSNAVVENLPFEYSLDAPDLNDGTTVTWTPAPGMDLVEKLTTLNTNVAVDGDDAANRTAISATITGLSIPNNAVFRIRWSDTNDNGNDGMYAIDDFTMTATVAGGATCTAPAAPTFSSTNGSSTSVSFVPDATNTSPYTITATPVGGGTAITATGNTSPISLMGLAASTSYSVTVTATCTAATGGGTVTSTTATVTTTSAPATNPVPTITGLTPSSATAGDPAQTLTVEGTNFVGASVVNFNGTARTTTYVSATELTIALTTADLMTAGSYNVTVTNPAPGGGTTAASTFTVNPVPAPTLTAINPSNPIGGATYVFTLTGTDFGTTANTTVSFNGTTVVPTSVNGGGTTLVVSLPLPSAGGTFPITVTTPNGTSGPQSLTVAALPAGFFEPFEPGTQGSYATTPTAVTLRTGSYLFLQALLGNLTPPGDKFNNTQSVRIRGGGSITMDFDKANGAGDVTISAARYGTDAAASLTLEYSIDGGTTFLPAPGSPAVLTTTLTPYSFTLNVSGPVRLRIGTTTVGASPRINVDDLQIADFTASVCNAPTNLSTGSITSSSATVSFTGSASAANGYTVTTTPATTTQTLVSSATSVSLTGLMPNTAYSVSIVSNCSATSTSTAATISFTTLALAPTLAVTQSGTGYASGGTAYSFGNQAVNTTSSPVTFTLTNSGPDPLTITGITTTGNYSVSGTAPTTVPAGGTATVNLTFTPTGTGTRSGTLVIASNATGGATYTVNLTGNGQAAPTATLAVSQGSTGYTSGGAAYSFGNQTVGITGSPVAFTLTNSGNSPLTIMGSNTTGDFAVSGTAPTTVPANGTATVNVTFMPMTTGPRTGTLVISSNASNAPVYTVNLTGNGQAAALTDLVVTTGTPTAPTPIMGNYNNVTIVTGGYAALAGPLTAAGTFTIQTGAGLLQGGLGQPCQLLTGTGSFNLQDGGTLAICDPAGISPTGVPTGAVLLTGTRTYSALAQYIYTGNAAQITGLGLPGTVLALGVQNAAGVTLSRALSLTQGLNLSQGNLNTGSFTFTLLSSAAGTAGVVNAGGVVVGSTTVQRYINNSNPIGYRHYSAPVSNTTLSDLTVPGVFTPTFNTAYNNSADPSLVTPFPTVFGYNQDRIATVTSTYGPFDKGWFSPVAATPMAVGKGYTVNAPNNALVDFVGTLNNGSVPSGTLNRGADAAAGWHLLGNPYPSPLDWSTVTTSQRPGMDAAIYVFESAGQYGGSYRASVNGVGGNGNSPQPIVVSSQGYFVRVTAPNSTGAVNLDNTNRVTTFGPQPSFGRGTADLRPQLRLELLGNGLADRAHLYFQTGATAGVDAEFDAVKLPNPTGLNLASLAGAEDLAINGLPTLGAAAVLVPLRVGVPQAGSYSLNAGDLANLTGTTVTLVDALTGTRTVLTTGTTYAFSLSGTTATGRFTLEFRSSGVLATSAAQALGAQVQLFPNPTADRFHVQLPVLSGKAAQQAVSLRLTNALGQTVMTRNLPATAGRAIETDVDVHGFAAGIYNLHLSLGDVQVVRRVVVQ